MIEQAGLHQLQDLEPSAAEFARAVVAGLSAPRRTLPCKFFYDAAGSALFDRICQLPEYYLTRTECRILAEQAGAIAGQLATYGCLVEFGAGSASKVGLLLARIHRPLVYVPVDISRSHLLGGAAALARSFPRLRIAPICADYTQPFALPEAATAAGAAAGFFPGSTIGNFAPQEAVAFLRRARSILGHGALMIVGADLQKDPATLHAAYNDAAGVTAAFNLNLLRRINRELGGNFDLPAFAHRALWNAQAGRIEMHLLSLRRQSVEIGAHRFEFAAGETIHTENSYKYTLDGFDALARAAGFEPVQHWTDDASLFSVHALRAT